MRTCDWHKPYAKYPVWVVAESSQYDYGIVFSDYGFAPEHPRGLAFSSHDNFDADYCWYPSLGEAYKESAWSRNSRKDGRRADVGRTSDEDVDRVVNLFSRILNSARPAREASP